MRLEPIPGHEHYFAREDGVIFSDRSGILKPLKPGCSRSTRTKTYTWLSVQVGHGKTRSVHRLVCMAFHGPPPGPEHTAAHLNGNPMDNRPENLAWKTQAENLADKILHGTSARGSRHPKAKLNEDQVREARKLLAEGWTKLAIASRYGVSFGAIDNMARGTSWGWLT